MRRPELKQARRPWLTLVALCAGTFAVLLDATIVNVALPSIITGLHAPLDEAIWVANAYLLTFTALLIVASRLGDMFGPRRLFTAGLAVFALASALCGVAQSPGQLIAARVLQGIGAAALTPQAMVIIQAVFPRERMGAAFGIFSSMVGLAAVSGPALGGVLTTYLGWRWVFYVNLPVVIAGIAAAYLFVPDIRTGRRRRLDLVGVLLASAGLSAVVYGVIEGQRYSWSAMSSWLTIPEIIAVGVAALAVFVLWEHRYGEPLVPLGLFRSRQFAILVTLNLLVQFALQSMLLANAINWQSVLGMTAVLAGLTSLPLTLALTVLAPFAGRLTDRLGGKYVLMAGLAVYAAGIAGVAMVSTTHATSLTFAPVLLLGGLGMGAIFAPLATEALRAAPVRLAGAASGVLNTARQLGGTLGSAITGAVLATRLTSGMEQRAHAVAQTLPPSARAPLIGGFAHAAKTGLRVGRGQAAASLPDGTPAQLVPYLHRVIHDIFGASYIAALHPALGISVAALLAGAAACPLLRRSTAPALAEQPAAGGPGPGAETAPAPSS